MPRSCLLGVSAKPYVRHHRLHPNHRDGHRHGRVQLAGENRVAAGLAAHGLAGLFGPAYIVVAPIIGIIGAFISGSATVSCTLFSALQYTAAASLGLPTMLILAMQVMGGAMGNMICVNNIVAACATCGTVGAEGRLMRTNAIPCFIYAALTVLIIGGLILANFDPYPL